MLLQIIHSFNPRINPIRSVTIQQTITLHFFKTDFKIVKENICSFHGSMRSNLIQSTTIRIDHSPKKNPFDWKQFDQVELRTFNKNSIYKQLIQFTDRSEPSKKKKTSNVIKTGKKERKSSSFSSTNASKHFLLFTCLSIVWFSFNSLFRFFWFFSSFLFCFNFL